MPGAVRRGGVLVHVDKSGALPLTARLVAWLQARAVEVTVLPEVGSALGGGVSVSLLPELASQCGLVVVLGGDGTLLGAARRTASYAPALLGVNLGRLGFLTELEQAELFAELPGILTGRFEIDERAMLAAVVRGGGSEAQTYLALNDVVVTKGPFSRLMRLCVRSGGREVAAYPGDGIILSTPTGSTAYALSAGGPILHPQVHGILITPICPHSFYARPTVVGAGERLRVEVSPVAGPRGPVDVALTVDAQEGRSLQPGEWVDVSTAPQRARLVRRPGWNFYEVLRGKLADGGNRGDG